MSLVVRCGIVKNKMKNKHGDTEFGKGGEKFLFFFLYSSCLRASVFFLNFTVPKQKKRFSLEGIIDNGQVDEKALDEVTKIWESRELQ